MKEALNIDWSGLSFGYMTTDYNLKRVLVKTFSRDSQVITLKAKGP